MGPKEGYVHDAFDESLMTMREIVSLVLPHGISLRENQATQHDHQAMSTSAHDFDNRPDFSITPCQSE